MADVSVQVGQQIGALAGGRVDALNGFSAIVQSYGNNTFAIVGPARVQVKIAERVG